MCDHEYRKNWEHFTEIKWSRIYSSNLYSKHIFWFGIYINFVQWPWNRQGFTDLKARGKLLFLLCDFMLYLHPNPLHLKEWHRLCILIWTVGIILSLPTTCRIFPKRTLVECDIRLWLKIYQTCLLFRHLVDFW